MKHLTHLATRLFNTPLLIAPEKLEVIVSVLAPRLGLEAPPVPDAAAAGYMGRKPYAVTEDGIAIIPIDGTLVHKTYSLDVLSGMRSYERISEEVLDAVTDPKIAAVLLEVDSPGGEVAGVFDLADEIHAARSVKPIFAVANNDAFSAAYLLASSAERVYATRTSGMGSIGVIVTHVDVSDADKKAGVKYTVVHAGARKADFHPHRPLSDKAMDLLAVEVERTYDLLVRTVARNRRMSGDKVRGTDAGLYFGEAAVRAGLADKMGTKQDALADLRTRIAGATDTRRSRPESSHRAKGETMPPTDSIEITTEQTEQPAVGEQPEAATTGQPVALESTALVVPSDADVRAAAFAEAREIAGLCILAGDPDQIAGLLERGVTVEEARQHVHEKRASAADAETIRSHVDQDAGTSVAASTTSPVIKAAENIAARMKRSTN